MVNAPPPSGSKSENTGTKITGIQKLAQIFLFFLFSLASLFLFEIIFQPLDSRNFLVFLSYDMQLRTYAYSVGFIFSIPTACFFWKSWDFEQNREKIRSTSGKLKYLTILVFGPCAAFLLGWSVVVDAIPLLRHQFAFTTEARYSFKITGFTYDRRCRGVRASNPLFRDDELCGVEVPGHSNEWRGRTIVVTGKKSRFGLTLERYEIENRK